MRSLGSKASSMEFEPWLEDSVYPSLYLLAATKGRHKSASGGSPKPNFLKLNSSYVQRKVL